MSEIDTLFETLRSSRFREAADPNRVPQSGEIGTGNPQPTGWVGEGVVDAPSLDTTAPAAPTGLTLSSDVVSNSDGSSFVRLLVGLIQPSATDLYGSYVEVTSHNDGGDPPNPVWDRPEVILITDGQTQGRIDNVRGVTQYWARARATDVLGNFSSYTSVVSHTTVGDTTPPPTPGTPVVTAGFRGFGAFWTGGDAEDLARYDLRWAQAASPPVDDGAWTYGQALVSVVFISNLTEDLLYWFQVRSVDWSGNASAWSTAVSVTPTLIGSADIAANSITSAMIQAGALDADKISTGTLTIQENGNMHGVHVLTAGGTLVVDLHNDGTMKFVDPDNPSNYLFIDAGVLKFTTDNGATFATALGPEGLNASAITFGEQAGGHNLLLNSSFELSGLVSAPSTALFTDNSGTPGWKAANRTTAPINTTEGAADLQIAATTY